MVSDVCACVFQRVCVEVSVNVGIRSALTAPQVDPVDSESAPRFDKQPERRRPADVYSLFWLQRLPEAETGTFYVVNPAH